MEVISKAMLFKKQTKHVDFTKGVPTHLCRVLSIPKQVQLTNAFLNMMTI